MNFLGHISSDINILNILIQVYPWIPNKDTIRPSEKVLEKKIELIEKLNNQNILLSDHIITTIFNNDDNKVFIENPFPYNINGNHYVMWYYNHDIIDRIFKDTQLIHDKSIIHDINIDIINSIYDIISHYNFNFAWYENPKMSINDKKNYNLYHIQVFWITNN